MKTKKILKKMMEAYPSTPSYLEDSILNMRYPVTPNMDNNINPNTPPELSLKERQDFMHQKMLQGEIARYHSSQQDEFVQNMLSVLIQQSRSMHKTKDRIQELESMNESLEDSIYKLSNKLKKEKHKYQKSEKCFKKMAHEIQKIETFLIKQSFYYGISDKNASFDELPYDLKAYHKSGRYETARPPLGLPDHGGQ